MPSHLDELGRAFQSGHGPTGKSSFITTLAQIWALHRHVSIVSIRGVVRGSRLGRLPSRQATTKSDAWGRGRKRGLVKWAKFVFAASCTTGNAT